MAIASIRKMVGVGTPPEQAKVLDEVAAGAVAAKAQIVALTAMTATATTGTLPTPNGSVTIADAATPTVVELLEFCMELKAKVDAAVSALKA